MDPTDYGVIVVVFFLLLERVFNLLKHFGDRLLSKKNGVTVHNTNGYKDVWALHFEKSLDKLTESIDSNTKVNTELAKEIHDILSALSRQEEKAAL